MLFILTIQYYCFWYHQYTFKKDSSTMIWIWRGGRTSKTVFLILTGASTNWVKIQSWRAPVRRRNQSRVPIFSLVLPRIGSNSSHDPQTLQHWFFTGITQQLSKKFQQVNNFLLFILKYYYKVYSNFCLWTKFVPKR